MRAPISYLLGFADALSRVGVKYLAASPEVMLAPGVPSTVAHAIAHDADPRQMARSIVSQMMRTQYASSDGDYTATAAFNVLDISPEKVDAVRASVKALNSAIVAAVKDDKGIAAAIRADERSVPGMARFTRASMPWHADRPAIALYENFARNDALPAAVRTAAHDAAAAVRSMVLAHKESAAYEPFGNRDYRDAVGPTVHAPTTAKQIDPWAPEVRETANAFWKETGGDKLARTLA